MPSSFELMVIALVALIVIGPERLPKVARTAGLLLSRLQRYVRDVKADINREIQLEELKKFKQEVTDQALGVEQSVGKEVKSVDEHLKSVETTLNESIAQGVADRPAEPAVAPPPDPLPDKSKT